MISYIPCREAWPRKTCDRASRDMEHTERKDIFMNKLTPEQLVLLNQKIIGGDEQPALGKDFNYDSFLILAELPYEKNKELFYA